MIEFAGYDNECVSPALSYFPDDRCVLRMVRCDPVLFGFGSLAVLTLISGSAVILLTFHKSDFAWKREMP